MLLLWIVLLLSPYTPTFIMWRRKSPMALGMAAWSVQKRGIMMKLMITMIISLLKDTIWGYCLKGWMRHSPLQTVLFLASLIALSMLMPDKADLLFAFWEQSAGITTFVLCSINKYKAVHSVSSLWSKAFHPLICWAFYIRRRAGSCPWYVGELPIIRVGAEENAKYLIKSVGRLSEL